MERPMNSRLKKEGVYKLTKVRVIASYRCPKGHTDMYFGHDRLPKWLRCRQCGKVMKRRVK